MPMKCWDARRRNGISTSQQQQSKMSSPSKQLERGIRRAKGRWMATI